MIDEKDMIFLKHKFVHCFLAGRQYTLSKFISPPFQDAKEAAVKFVEKEIIGKPEDKNND